MTTKHVVPAEHLPPLQFDKQLRDDETRMLRDTFLRLSQIFHALQGHHGDDALLLLTTCRNHLYTLNALYAEARKWATEGGRFTGFGDGLDMLRAPLTEAVDIKTGARRAAVVLRSAAAYLSEFEKKYELYYQHFEETRQAIIAAASTISDVITREAFVSAFCDIGSGPGPDHRLTPPSDAPDVLLERLLIWYSLARPLTGLARTFISQSIGIGGEREKTCADYILDVELGKRALRSFGFHSTVPPIEIAGEVSPALLEAFIRYADDAYRTCREFLGEMLPGKRSVEERFALQIGTPKTVEVRGQIFRREQAFVLITDMRNSTGARHVAPDLKVKIDQVIDALRQEVQARSQTTYDDCRVVACESLQHAAACAARLVSALDIHKTPEEFGGLRMGLSYGEMLFADDLDIRKAAPADDAHNTIARAARLMSLDGTRWENSPLGETVRTHLGDWTAGEALVFFDESVFVHLPEPITRACREIDVVKFKGVGPHRCFAAPINGFAGLF